MDIPTEESTNWVSHFSTNTNKLISDKGNIKQEDLEAFKNEVYKNPKFSAKLPYVKVRTMKMNNDQVRPTFGRHRSHVVK